MENIKEIFASFSLWSLVEDISDDGDGIGDDLQLTKEGEEARRMIERELDKARKEGRKEGSKKLYRSISKELYKLYSDIDYLGDLRDDVYDLSDKYEKLSKLKTKEDGK